MDHNFLLSVAKLTLNPDLQRGCVAHETYVLKNVSAQRYLRVNAAQLVVLDTFSEGCTVPEAFARLLRDRFCLPVREFYELVLKAHEAGILYSTQLNRPVREPLRWWGFRGGFLMWPMALLVTLTFVGLGWRAPELGLDRPSLVIGLAVAFLAWLAGQAFGASLLAGAGGEIYPGKRTLGLPLRLDKGDARLTRPGEQALVALGENLPLTLCLLASLWRFPLLTGPVAAAWLLMWRPWGTGLPRRLADLMSRYPQLDTDFNFLFIPNQRPQMHWRPWWRRWDWRVCAIELVWAVAWSLLVARLLLAALGLSFMEVATDWNYWSVTLPVLVSLLLVSIVAGMVRRWRGGFREVWRRFRRWVARVHRHWRQEYVFPDNEPALLRLASMHPLLRQLNPYDQSVVVRAWRPVTYKAWKPMLGSTGGNGEVGLILSGRAVAYRTGKNGRRMPSLNLEEGDFFGVPHPKIGEDGFLEVMSRTPVAAVLLPAEVFQSVVAARLNPTVIYDLTHKYTFLQRLPICSHWDSEAVARFARMSQVTSYADGETILEQNEETHWFYILFEGMAQVRRQGKVLTRLKPGDFFGEISLLQNSVATADVVAQGRVRCLQIDRVSFLRFMTHNHHVALELERISSARLGRPIFPLGSSFEMNAA